MPIKKQNNILYIERACSDLRRGMAVAIQDGNKKILVISPENQIYINKLTKFVKEKDKQLVISSTRAKYLLKSYKSKKPAVISASKLTEKNIANFCYSGNVKLKISDFTKPDKLAEAALQLVKIAELIPAAIIFRLEDAKQINEDILVINCKSINSYKDESAYNLTEACRAPLTLTHANKAEIIAYRPTIGAPEHYAIIIGKPGKNPLVRVHSSCYTGDLLSSLSCDCRDQLQSAIQMMGEKDGGIILYLMQEGRGIGLVNKLRAYDLKNKGMDTVEANRALGFDDDERLFLPAAEILKKLGIKQVRLLTNNPRKAAGLEECGIIVTECVKHIMETNSHNREYLSTKAKKLGHRI